MKRLDGKVALVTGGGTGIGRGIARTLHDEGCRVAVCGRRPEPINAVAAEITKVGGQALAVPADVSKEADVERLVQAVLKAFARIDFLINNAGVGGGRALHETEPDEWGQVMDINLRGPFLMMRAVLPHLRAQKSGHIINISSESGLNYYNGDAIYGTSKHALNDLGEYVQRENQDLNIRVNTICPGMVVSEMTQNDPGLDHSKCLYPEDIAELVVWLLTRRENIKIGTPILIQTMLNPWE